MTRNFGISILLVVLSIVAYAAQSQGTVALQGAYQLTQGEVKHILVFSDDYYVHTTFDQNGKNFQSTEGGLFKIREGKLLVKMEFDSKNKDLVDSIFTYLFTSSKNALEIALQGSKTRFEKIDDGDGILAGAWRITGRMQDGKFTAMPPGSRKTIKLLSGTRFQWIALNAQSKEFFGTGGGSYTFAGGKYTEKIEFFPRDNTRVGSALIFDDKIESGEWYHTGKSSAGDNVFEIWKKASIIVE